jgi:hypothetical protein
VEADRADQYRVRVAGRRYLGERVRLLSAERPAESPGRAELNGRPRQGKYEELGKACLPTELHLSTRQGAKAR